MKSPLKLDSLGSRLRWVREKFGWTLEGFGDRLGVGRSYLSKLENGKNKNPSGPVVNMICQTYAIRREWLLDGQGVAFEAEYLNRAAEAGNITDREIPHPITIDERTKSLALFIACLLKAKTRSKEALAGLLAEVLSNPFPLPGLTVETARLLSEELCQTLSGAMWAPPGHDAPAASNLRAVLAQGTIARATYDQLLSEAAALGAEKKLLTDVTVSDNVSPVKSTMANLLDRLNKATNQRGMKSKLAKVMEVPLSNVSQWLSGEREPGGETTLRLLNWVIATEAKQESPGGVEAPPEPKTQPRKSKHENQSQARKKR